MKTRKMVIIFHDSHVQTVESNDNPFELDFNNEWQSITFYMNGIEVACIYNQGVTE